MCVGGLLTSNPCVGEREKRLNRKSKVEKQRIVVDSVNLYGVCLWKCVSRLLNTSIYTWCLIYKPGHTWGVYSFRFLCVPSCLVQLEWSWL